MCPRHRHLLSFCFRVSCAVVLLAFRQSAVADDAPAVESDVRAAVSRSVPLIVENGEAWIEERGCVSCHRIGMMTWSLTEAARHGFAVDRTRLEEWVDWSLEATLAEDRKTGDPIGIRNPEGMGQLLLGRERTDVPASRQQAYESFVALLVRGQKAGGDWKPGGQLPQQKRPLAETTAVSTMWNTVALLDADERSEDVQNSLQAASKNIEMVKPGISTEWYVVRLLLAVKQGAASESDAWLQRLRSLQQSDGGWGWIADESSDALATGMALYALRQAGVATDDQTVRSAVGFLIATQLEDGSWEVHGTKEASREEFEETSGFWGTTWATLGLLRTLPGAGAED